MITGMMTKRNTAPSVHDNVPSHRLNPESVLSIPIDTESDTSIATAITVDAVESVESVDGAADGLTVGSVLGSNVGSNVGSVVGSNVGSKVGSPVGSAVGDDDGEWDGVIEGAMVGGVDGAKLGAIEGAVEGEEVGDVVGPSVCIGGVVIGMKEAIGLIPLQIDPALYVDVLVVWPPSQAVTVGLIECDFHLPFSSVSFQNHQRSQPPCTPSHGSNRLGPHRHPQYVVSFPINHVE